MTLTIALLLIAGANIGVLLLIKALFSHIHTIHHNQNTADVSLSGQLLQQTVNLSDYEKSHRKQYSRLANAMAQAFEATGKLIADTAEGSAKDTHSLKLTFAGMRHDMALDRQGLDEHDDASRNRQAELVAYVQREGLKTRKEIEAIVEEGGRIISYYADEQSKLKDCVVQEGAQTRGTVELEHKKTRKESQEIKMALRDDEKEQQRRKREVRAEAKKAGADMTVKMPESYYKFRDVELNSIARQVGNELKDSDGHTIAHVSNAKVNNKITDKRPKKPPTTKQGGK